MADRAVFNVAGDIHRAVKAAADDLGVSISEFVTRACTKELAAIYGVDAERLRELRADRDFIKTMGDRSDNSNVVRMPARQEGHC